jgi:hypothetical protein
VRVLIVCQPPVDVGRGEVAQLPGAQAGDDVRAREDGVVVSGVLRVRAESVGQPVVDRVSDGQAAGGDGEAVFVFADLLAQFGAGFGLGLAAAFADDALSCRGIADGDRGYPALASFVPVQSAFSTASAFGHRVPPFVWVSCSSRAM